MQAGTFEQLARPFGQLNIGILPLENLLSLRTIRHDVTCPSDVTTTVEVELTTEHQTDSPQTTLGYVNS